jgi:hypothetical protein
MGDFVRGGCIVSCSFSAVEGVDWMARVGKEGETAKSVEYGWKSKSPSPALSSHWGRRLIMRLVGIWELRKQR